ncbi:MAG: NERD domain-containing protein [Betaproteobacteria bacterium]|nr:NERD domain-containing protein [Betaproteobacteria bacterium]
MLVAALLIALAAVEWYRAYFPQPPSPGIYSAFAALGMGYAIFRLRRAWPELRALRLAIDGERAVGQFLERLREKGYQVFHDVMGPRFNLDHVIIGPAGIFAIETKTFSKPARGEAKVACDGQKILIDGLAPERDPIAQARAQASWLRGLLTESTGRKLSVRSVILFPGWYVEQDRATRREFWVLNPKALPTFLDHEPATMSTEDVKLASFHLSRFIRAGEK